MSRSSRFFSLVDFHFSRLASQFELFLCLSAITVGFAAPTFFGCKEFSPREKREYRYDRDRDILDEIDDVDGNLDRSAEEPVEPQEHLRGSLEVARGDDSFSDGDSSELREEEVSEEEPEEELEEEPAAPKTIQPEPVKSLFEAVERLAFDKNSYYVNEESGKDEFCAAFVSVAWDGFSGIVDYCSENDLVLRLEYLPLMNPFVSGKCRRVTQREAPDGGWVYDFFWKPNNAKGEEQVLLTITLSESGITAEQKELVDSTLSTEEAILVLKYLRIGTLRWSFTDKDSLDTAEPEMELVKVTQLFAPVEIADKLEPSPQPISLGDRLKKMEVLPDVNFDADTSMKLKLTSCAGLEASEEKGRTSFLFTDGVFRYQVTFVVTPTEENPDDRQLITIALINNFPADAVVREFFFRSGAIEKVEARILEKEAAIIALEGQYVEVPFLSSRDPKENQRLFSQRKRLERANRNIDSRIRRLTTQIGRDRKSLDVELSKRLKKNIKFFRDRFAITYGVYLTNDKIGPEEFLLCDSFIDSSGYEVPEDGNEDLGEGNGLVNDAEFDFEPEEESFDEIDLSPEDASKASES